MTINEWFQKKQEDFSSLRRKKLRWEGAAAKSKTFAFVLLIIGEIVLFVALAKAYGLLPQGVVAGAKVAVIDFDKQITPQTVKEVIATLETVKENKSYKGLLFIVNSGGGSPSGADELAAYLKDFNQTKPTYLYVQHIAASGGYYLASAIKPIYANPNAIVGSIGVILPHFSLEKLAQTLGVQEDDLTVGKYKKPISYIKKMTTEQKNYLKAHLLLPTYRNFLETVAKYRGVDLKTLERFADGKIYIANSDAIRGVLVDEVIRLHELKDKIKKRLGKDIRFVDPMPKGAPKLFGGGKIDVSLDLGTKNTPLLGPSL